MSRNREGIRRGGWLLGALLLASASIGGLPAERPTLTELRESAAHRIEVSTATAAEWHALPGIGVARARALAAAGRRGELIVPADVLTVPGIGAATFARLRPHLESTR